jgi:transposase InsO family protein
MGYLNWQTLHELSASGGAHGMPYIPILWKICPTCQLGKHACVPLPKASSTRASSILEVLHTDLCEPMQIASLGGYLYFMVIVDDYSKMVWVRFMANKSSAFQHFAEFITLIEAQIGKKVLVIRFDRGGEFTSTEFKNLCAQKGIQRQLTNADTPK